MRPFLVVADLSEPRVEPFAVISIDPSVRVGQGVRGTVMSLHWTKAEAELAAADAVTSSPARDSGDARKQSRKDHP